MLFLVIGLFVVVAVGAFLRQQAQQNQNQDSESESNTQTDPHSLDLPDEDAIVVEDDDDEEPGFILSAKQITDPERASGATYSSHAPAGEESPYG